MSMTVETATLPTLLTALRLPTVARLWPEFCTRADKEGWPAERLLAALCELELSEREQAMVHFATKLTQTPSEMREDTTARQPHLRYPPVMPSATAL